MPGRMAFSQPYLLYIQVLVLFLGRLIEQMVVMSIVAYVANAMNLFGVPWIDTGFYSGLAMLLLACGSVIGGPFHGILLDHLKQRTIFAFEMLMLSLSTVVLSLANGIISLSFGACLVGIFQCLVVVNRVIANSISDSNNASIVVTIAVSAGASLGCFVGPAVAGALLPQSSDPEDITDLFIRHHPLFKPYIVMGGIALVVSIMGLVVLPNEVQSKKPVKYQNIQPDQDSSESLISTTSSDMSTASSDTSTTSSSTTYKHVFMELAGNKGFAVLNILWFIHGCGFSVFAVSLALIIDTPKSKGGAGFPPMKTSRMMTVAGTIVFIVEFLFVGPIIHKVGAKTALLGTYLSMILLRSLPGLTLGIPDDIYFWFIVFDVAIARIALSFEQITISIIFNELTPVKILGKATGLSYTLAELGDVIFLFGTGYLFALSLKNEKLYDVEAIGFPFNHTFTFYIAAVLGLTGAIVTSKIPRKKI